MSLPIALILTVWDMYSKNLLKVSRAQIYVLGSLKELASTLLIVFVVCFVFSVLMEAFKAVLGDDSEDKL